MYYLSVVLLPRYLWLYMVLSSVHLIPMETHFCGIFIVESKLDRFPGLLTVGNFYVSKFICLDSVIFSRVTLLPPYLNSLPSEDVQLPLIQAFQRQMGDTESRSTCPTYIRPGLATTDKHDKENSSICGADSNDVPGQGDDDLIAFNSDRNIYYTLVKRTFDQIN